MPRRGRLADRRAPAQLPGLPQEPAEAWGRAGAPGRASSLARRPSTHTRELGEAPGLGPTCSWVPGPGLSVGLGLSLCGRTDSLLNTVTPVSGRSQWLPRWLRPWGVSFWLRGALLCKATEVSQEPRVSPVPAPAGEAGLTAVLPPSSSGGCWGGGEGRSPRPSKAMDAASQPRQQGSPAPLGSHVPSRRLWEWCSALRSSRPDTSNSGGTPEAPASRLGEPRIAEHLWTQCGRGRRWALLRRAWVTPRWTAGATEPGAGLAGDGRVPAPSRVGRGRGRAWKEERNAERGQHPAGSRGLPRAGALPLRTQSPCLGSGEREILRCPGLGNS